MADTGAVTGETVSTKVVVKNVDMAEDMQQEAIDLATSALEKFSVEKDMAAHIKKECDRRFGHTWHVVVGKNFGSYVTHGASYSPATAANGSRGHAETKHFIYFYVGPLAVLMWRS